MLDSERCYSHMNSNNYRIAFEKKLKGVFRGWNSILDITKDCREAPVLLVTEDTLEIKELFIKYLGHFIKMYTQVFILMSIDMDELNVFLLDKVTLKRVSEAEMNDYLLYALISQEPNIRIMSMKVKNVRNVNNFLGFKKIDKDTIVSRGIFGIVGEIDD